jgi:polar amino acid transport system substrate-binding protein
MNSAVIRRFVAVWLGLVASFSAFGEGTTIRLRADQWMPFNGDPKDERPGYVIEMARAIFGKRGIVVDYQTMPWTDALKAAGDAEIEGVIGANTKEAAALIVPSEPIGLPRVGLFVRKGNPWQFTSVAALKSVKLGAIESYSYWDGLDDYIKSHGAPQVTVFKGETPLVEAIAKLDAGEIDLMPEMVPVFIWTAKKLGHAGTDYRAAWLQPGDPVYVAFAKTDAGRRYAQMFDEGVRAMRKSGELKKLLAAYSLEDWQ